MFDYKRFGEDVRTYRQGNQLTLKDVAALMNISVTTLRRIEGGHKVHLYHVRTALRIIKKHPLDYVEEKI